MRVKTDEHPPDDRPERDPAPTSGSHAASRTENSLPQPLRFAVQKHAATRLHYDFRLEWGGVLLSWAVTKGPSLDPSVRRLAVRVGDHDLDYAAFEGTIPAGTYGGGTVMLWDEGAWEPLDDPKEGLGRGRLRMRLDGSRMTGGWTLIRMRPRARERRESWLLVKDDDVAASRTRDILEETSSVRSGRTMDEIAKGAPPA